MKTKIAAVLLLVPVLLSIHGHASGAGPPDNLYGTSPVDPIIQQGEIVINLRDGHVVRSGANVSYVLSDHLGSDRVVHNTAVEYDPYGRASGTSASYTGKILDPETGTYDFGARQYDPGLGRFSSRDPAHTGNMSPYLYAMGKPTGMVDPDGKAPIYFFLYSEYGVRVPDRTGRPSLHEDITSLRRAALQSTPLVMISSLEAHRGATLPVGTEMEHLTLVMHGLPGKAFVRSPSGNEPRTLTGTEFVDFLRSRLQYQFGSDIASSLKSVHFDSCYAAYCTKSLLGSSVSEDSFIHSFAQAAGERFPALRRVVASPYVVGSSSYEEGGSSLVSMESFTDRTRANMTSLSYIMSPDDYFMGRFKPELFGKPHYKTVSSIVGSRILPGERIFHHDKAVVQDFMHTLRGIYTEPVLREISIVPAPVVGE